MVKIFSAIFLDKIWSYKPSYRDAKLHMMNFVKEALKDADILLLIWLHLYDEELKDQKLLNRIKKPNQPYLCL